MTSTSAGGVSVIVLQFNLSLGLDVAEEEVQSAINGGQSFLPSDLPVPPSITRPILPTRPSSPWPSLPTPSLFAGRGYGRHPPGAPALPVERRGTGQHQRRTEARRPHSGHPVQLSSYASIWRMCGLPSHRPASIPPRATSMGPARTTRSTPTTRSLKPTSTRTCHFLLQRRAGPGEGMSPTSSTALRTPSRPHG